MSRVVVYDKIQFDDCVIDAACLVKWLVDKTYEVQQQLFKHPREHNKYSVPYTNNYYICVDTIFRMTTITLNLMKKFENDYGVKHFTFVLDGNDVCAAIKAMIPGWRRFFYYSEFKYAVNKEYAYRALAYRLLHLVKFLTDEEIGMYECYEKFITKTYPHLIRFALCSRTPLFDFTVRERLIAKNKFFGMLQLIQSEITDNEWVFIINAFFTQLHTFANVDILISHESAYGGAFEVAIYKLNNVAKCTKETTQPKHNERVLVVSSRLLKYVGAYTYYLDEKHLYTSSLKHKLPSQNIPYVDKVSFGNNTSLIKLYELCENEMEHSIINTNPYNQYNIFVDVQHLYSSKTTTSKTTTSKTTTSKTTTSKTTTADDDKRITPSPTYEEPEKTLFTNMTLDRECVVNALGEFIASYNEKYNTVFTLSLTC